MIHNGILHKIPYKIRLAGVFVIIVFLIYRFVVPPILSGNWKIIALLFAIPSVILIAQRPHLILYLLILMLPARYYPIFGELTGLIYGILLGGLFLYIGVGRRTNFRILFRCEFLLACSLAAYFLLTVPWAPDSHRALNIVVGYMTYTVLPFGLLLILLKRWDDFKPLINFYLIVGIIDVLLSLIQQIMGNSWSLLYLFSPQSGAQYKIAAFISEGGTIASVGFFWTSAINGLFLNGLLIIILSKYLCGKWSARRTICLAVPTAFAVLATWSRINAVLMIGFILLMPLVKVAGKKQIRSLFFNCILVATTFALLLAITSMTELGQSIYGAAVEKFATSQTSYYVRFHYWESALKQLTYSGAYVYGLGLGATGNLGTMYEIHNAYIELFAEGGILACFLFGTLIILTLKRGIQVMRSAQKANRTAQYEVGLIGMGVMAAISCFYLVHGGLRTGDPVLALALGLIHSAYRIAQSSVNELGNK